jgi:hypothetical protein
MRPALLTLLLCSVPLTARAQLQLGIDSDTSASFSPSGCGRAFSVSWTYAGTGAACSALTVWLTTGTCGDAPTTGDHQVLSEDAAALLVQRTGTSTFSTTDLPTFDSTADGGVACGDAVTRTWRLCGYVEVPGFTGFGTACGSNNQKVRSSSVTVSYDGLPPDAPTLGAVTSQDGALRASVENVAGDAVEVRLGARVAGSSGDFALSDRVAVAGSTVFVTIDGLENDRQYEVVAYAVDAADNASEASEPLLGTPRRTQGFFGQYRAAGGDERGGCASAPAAALPLAALLLALSRRRRG